MMTLSHKEEALARWKRYADIEQRPDMHRKVNAAAAIDWGRTRHTLQIIEDAGYCLDNDTEAA